MMSIESKQHPNQLIIRTIRSAVLLLGIMGILAPTAFADLSKPEPVNYDKEYKSAEKLIYKKKYSAALKRLRKITKAKPENADAWNLQGFALRKTNNLEQAQVAYTKALNINPEHKGALEYQGELYIMLGDIDAAMGNLEKLKALCPQGCEELDLLQAALNQT